MSTPSQNHGQNDARIDAGIDGRNHAMETRLLAPEQDLSNPFAAAAAPLYQTATFDIGDPDEPSPYDYSRSGNPTRDLLEPKLCMLDSGLRSLAYVSGMAAIAAVCRLVGPGERLACGLNMYGGTTRLLSRVLDPLGVRIDRVDTTDPSRLVEHLHPETRLLLIETPSNPMMQVSDIREVVRIAHRVDCLVAVDASMMSPVLMRPLELGADIVIHSATKFLNGHSDVTAGVVTVGQALQEGHPIAETLAFRRNAEGTALPPFDAWLLHRGLKTLPLRVRAQQASAQLVASAVRAHPAVSEVHWLGFDDARGKAVHDAQAQGPGAVFSFAVGCPKRASGLLRQVRLFRRAVSFGGVASSLSVPLSMSHASVPAAFREELRLTPDLIRVSIGLESPEDLITDLRCALDAVCAD